MDHEKNVYLPLLFVIKPTPSISTEICLERNGRRLGLLNALSMVGFFGRMFDKLKAWIAWSWTYLWAMWFMLVVFVVYVLRGPLRIGENVSHSK